MKKLFKLLTYFFGLLIIIFLIGKFVTSSTLDVVSTVKAANATISGTVYLDNNNNSIYDSGDSNLYDTTMMVYLLDDHMNLISSAAIDTLSNGNYSFSGLNAGTYTVIKSRAYYVPTENPTGIKTVTVTDPSTTTINFGERWVPILLASNNPISGKVYKDLNNNSLLDSGEIGIPNLTLILKYSSNGTAIQVVETDSNGDYTFTQALEGSSVIMTLTNPGGYSPTEVHNTAFTINASAINGGGPMTGINWGQAPVFVTTWKTNNPGVTNSSSIKLNINPTYTYKYDVDWNNDGVWDTLNATTSVVHDYLVAGTYQVAIRPSLSNGSYPQIIFPLNVSNDSYKLLSVDQWGVNIWQSMQEAFASCVNLNFTANDIPNLSSVQSMNHMFSGDTIFNSSINNWNVSSVKDMSWMFFDAYAFNQPLNSWNTSNVNTMESMFNGAVSFNQSLNSWNTSNVTNMVELFAGATLFNQPLNNWDTSKVTDMAGLFANAISFNQDISSWNTSNVVTMLGMFSSASTYNQPLASWDVSKVQDFSTMFIFASKFNQDISSWNPASLNGISSLSDFLSASAMSIQNYDKLLISWNSKGLSANHKLGAAGIKYCLGESARNNLINNNNWTVFDSGKDCSMYQPTDITLSNNSLNENNLNPYTIGSLSTIDPNNTDTFTYSLNCSIAGTDDNAFHIVNGNKLEILVSTNFEAKSTYQVCARTTDSTNLTYEKLFTINVNDLDEIAPIVTLNGNQMMNVYIGMVFSDPGASWTDNVDGNGNTYASSGIVDSSILGTYILTYKYTDVAGNVSNIASRTVNVLPKPSIQIISVNDDVTLPYSTTDRTPDVIIKTNFGDTVMIPGYDCSPSPSTGTTVKCTSNQGYVLGLQTVEITITDKIGTVVKSSYTINIVEPLAVTGADKNFSILLGSIITLLCSSILIFKRLQYWTKFK